MYAFEIKLFYTQRGTQCLQKSFCEVYEVKKEDLSVKKTRVWFVFECETLKLVQ